MKKMLKRFLLWILLEKENNGIHPIQAEMLLLIKKGIDIKSIPLRKLGKIIGVSHPQQVKFHRDKISKLYG